MDSFEYNKMIGALLGTIFVVFTIALLSDAIFSSPKPEKEGFAIKAEETATATAAKPAAPVEIGPLLAKADPKKGEQIFHRCEACHDGTKGGPNKVGPNLWGVVDRPVASHPGFSYSSAMKKFSDGGKKHWTYQLISLFITSPRKEVPGTAMTFAGLNDAQDRANVISFLRTLSDNPVPLPSPEAEKSSAPADDGKAPAAGSDQDKAPAAESGQDKAPAETPKADSDNGQAPAQNEAPKTDDQTK